MTDPMGMLSLTRKRGQRIMIGDDIVVQVTSTDGTHVQLRVYAPRSIPVHREEIYHRIQAEIAAELEEKGDASEH